MFDSFGKPASGLFEGSLQWVGAYKECLNVHAFLPAGTRFGSRVLERSSEFDTNYCRVEILLDRGLWEKSSYAVRPFQPNRPLNLSFAHLNFFIAYMYINDWNNLPE